MADWANATRTLEGMASKAGREEQPLDAGEPDPLGRFTRAVSDLVNGFGCAFADLIFCCLPFALRCMYRISQVWIPRLKCTASIARARYTEQERRADAGADRDRFRLRLFPNAVFLTI